MNIGASENSENSETKIPAAEKSIPEAEESTDSGPGFWSRLLKTVERWTPLLNLALFVLSVIAVWISLKAYSSSEKSSQKQQEALDGSRAALESVVKTAIAQQDVFTQTLVTSRAQLKILQNQWNNEVRRQSQKPKLEFSLGDIPAKQLLKVQPIRVPLNKERKLGITFLVKNIGDAPVLHPTYMSSATNGVDVAPSQISGLNVSDILPFNRSKKAYSASQTATVPVGAERFRVRLEVWGDNLENSSIEVEFISIPDEVR